MDLKKKVQELTAYPTEANWFEFKENWYEPNGIGEYISFFVKCSGVGRTGIWLSCVGSG